MLISVVNTSILIVPHKQMLAYIHSFIQASIIFFLFTRTASDKCPVMSYNLHCQLRLNNFFLNDFMASDQVSQQD